MSSLFKELPTFSRFRSAYFWWESGAQFWLFTLYGKDEMADLSVKEKRLLKEMLKEELEGRR